jgi:hypothetical protein
LTKLKTRKRRNKLPNYVYVYNNKPTKIGDKWYKSQVVQYIKTL